MPTEAPTRLDGLRERFWRRHSNPKSGWSRTLLPPVVLYGIYRRNWRLLAVAAVFTVLNPLLFPPPKDDEAWMTRVVLAEQWWTDEMRRGLLDVSYPNVLNLLNVPVSVYALFSAYRRRPYRTALAGAASMALKFWFVGALVRRYDAREKDDCRTSTPDDYP